MKSLREMMDLTSRVALITGGAGQIGRGLCATLAELGADVVVLDMQRGPCEQVAAETAARYGKETLALVADLEKEEEVAGVREIVIDRFGRLDILVNCAAMAGSAHSKEWNGDFADQTARVWRKAHEINVTAPFVLAQSFAPDLQRSGHGSIINILSIYAVSAPDLRIYEGLGMGNPAAYASSKGGLLQLTRWLSTVLAPAVRVNAISPGGILADQPESFVARYSERTPLRRMGHEDDVRGAVAYLATDLSAYVTGQNLLVDGGWTVW